VDPWTPEFNAVLDAHNGQIQQFIRAQHQRAQLSGLPQHKASSSRDGVTLSYHNNYGQDTLTVEVHPKRLEEIKSKIYPPLQDMEFGGYIYFEIDRNSGDPGDHFSMQLNGVELFSYTFGDFYDAAFWAVVTFGENALHYHSYSDEANEVTQRFIQYPSPKYKDKNYVYMPYDPVSGFGSGDFTPILLPYYAVFRVPGGVLGLNHMTLWDGVNTPLLVDAGSNRFIGGGVQKFDDLNSSPLVPHGQNSITVTTSSNVFLSGYVMAEFFSRSVRNVSQSWRYTAADQSQQIWMNDQPIYLTANFSNNGDMSQAAWTGAFNTLDGAIASPPASTPAAAVSDPDTPVTALIIDLSK
jgi:hypothetical protein